MIQRGRRRHTFVRKTWKATAHRVDAGGAQLTDPKIITTTALLAAPPHPPPPSPWPRNPSSASSRSITADENSSGRQRNSPARRSRSAHKPRSETRVRRPMRPRPQAGAAPRAEKRQEDAARRSSASGLKTRERKTGGNENPGNDKSPQRQSAAATTAVTTRPRGPAERMRAYEPRY